jgi:Chaperone of endosialidase
MNATRTGARLVALLATLFLSASIIAQPRAVVQQQSGATLQWRADFVHAAASLRIAGPNGVVEKNFGAEAVEFLADASKLKDGRYVFEITFVSSLPPPGLSRDTPRTPPLFARTSGGFLVESGVVYSAASMPALRENQRPDGKRAAASDLKDVVVPDDNIVQGSLCVGLDCVNNESFGFDTIRLKENNTRIKFEDTSTGAFPTTDWQLTANDSASGGVNRFSIEDVTAATNPFTIVGGAPTNSVFVSSAGNLGLGTATPILDVHLDTNNTPGVRLEQNGTGGFSAQTWDVAGNEANFFVRDLTSGSRLPFRIRPGAPTSSIDIAASGNVGFGVAAPAQPFHLRRTDGSARMLLEEASPSTAARTLASFVNNGDVTVSYQSTAAPLTTWETAAGTAGFRVRVAGAATPQMTLAANGNLNIIGALTQASSVTLKENMAPVSGDKLLQTIKALPIYTWNYLSASKDEKHLGPTAEDFHRMFALGNNPKAIAPGDMAGVALGAIQALSAALSEKDRELAALRDRMSALEALVTGARRATR